MQALTNTHTLAKFLAPRQKRLSYWRMVFGEKGDPSEITQGIEEKLSTYGLLLTRLTKSTSEEDQKESVGRIEAIERELTSLFEEWRLATSRLKHVDKTAPVFKPRQ